MRDLLTYHRDTLPSDSKYKRERWITTEEAQALATILETEQIKAYFECGTANGFSALWAATALCGKNEIEQIQTWDPHSRPKLWEEPEFKTSQGFINYNHGRYAEGIRHYGPTRNKALYFIDGDHKMRAARNDIRATLTVAKIGDVILLHDVFGYEYLSDRMFEFSKNKRTAVIKTDRGIGVIWL